MRTSNYTLAALKTAAEEKVDYTIGNSAVVRAANHALKTYKKHERRAKMQFRHETISFAPNTGYSLDIIGLGNITAWVTATAYTVGTVVKEDGVAYVCVIAHTSDNFTTDLGNNRWEVYFPLESEETMRLFEANAQGQFDRHDEILPRPKQDQIMGYYIENDEILITPPPANATTSNYYVVEYFESPVLFSINQIDMSQFLPIDKNAEEIFEEFVLEKFFRTKSLMPMSQDAEARYIERLVEFFGDKDLKAVGLFL